MTPIEYIRHDYLGAMHITAICDDKDCRTSIGAKVIAQKHKGYEHEGAEEITPEERKKVDAVVAEHNRNHNIRVIIGHHSEMDIDKGVSKTVYEYKAKWSKHG